MESPYKRPRLSVFGGSVNTSPDLGTARYRNDIRLKSRFESIFEKYEKDFTGIADEIDLETGQILVDNGHVARMRDETDTGISQSLRPQTLAVRSPSKRPLSGGRLLRAMTVATPDGDAPMASIEEDDDVMLLFEQLAENVEGSKNRSRFKIKQESHSSDAGVASDDDDHDSLLGRPLDKSRSSSVDSLLGFKVTKERSLSGDSLLGGNLKRYSSTGVNSLLGDNIRHERTLSADSMLQHAEPASRSSSPDSLLEPQSPRSEVSRDASWDELDRANEYASPCPEPPGNPVQAFDDDSILQRYGSEVGGQVLEVLRQRQAAEEARYETAWRLPDIGPSFEEYSRDLGESVDEPVSQAPIDPPSPEKRSIWAPDIPMRKPLTRPSILAQPQPISDAASTASNDSEDPLQAAFGPQENENEHEPQSDSEEDPEYRPETETQAGPAGTAEWQKLVDQNICPYCKEHKAYLVQHFDAMVDNQENDVHDLEHLLVLRSQRIKRSNYEISLFLDVVQYRELEHLNFTEIATRCNTGQRQVYNSYYLNRLIQKSDEELAAEGRAWTQEEDDLIMQAAKRPNATFRSVKDQVPSRKNGEIGNRLGTLHMRELERKGYETAKPKWVRRSDAVERLKSMGAAEGQEIVRPGEANGGSMDSDIFGPSSMEVGEAVGETTLVEEDGRDRSAESCPYPVPASDDSDDDLLRPQNVHTDFQVNRR